MTTPTIPGLEETANPGEEPNPPLPLAEAATRAYNARQQQEEAAAAARTHSRRSDFAGYLQHRLGYTPTPDEFTEDKKTDTLFVTIDNVTLGLDPATAHRIGRIFLRKQCPACGVWVRAYINNLAELGHALATDPTSPDNPYSGDHDWTADHNSHVVPF